MVEIKVGDVLERPGFRYTKEVLELVTFKENIFLIAVDTGDDEPYAESLDDLLSEGWWPRGRVRVMTESEVSEALGYPIRFAKNK